jgi:hypothetical protein
VNNSGVELDEETCYWLVRRGFSRRALVCDSLRGILNFFLTFLICKG